MDPVQISMSWPQVALAYLPLLVTLAASIKAWLESKRTTAKVEIVDKAVTDVKTQGNSTQLTSLKNTARLLKLLAEDHPENAALQSEYAASMNDIVVHERNQAVIDDRKKQVA